ncbi:MAG: endonuclease MutS2 [Ruminococcaceae bacterium]|nr:endonuclease MutS2 [Oscillospiraceae bacterium]
MDAKSLITLEYNKILKWLASYTQNEPVRNRILSLTPTESLAEAQDLQRQTTEAVGIILRRGNPPGIKIQDVTSALMRVERGGSMNMGELLSVASLCKTARGIKRYIEDDKTVDAGTIFSLSTVLQSLRQVSDRIEEAVLSEEEMADGASPTLYQIRRKKKSLSASIRDTLQDMITSPKYQKALQDPIITMRGERYVLPVKAEAKNEIKGIVHDASASGATYFIEPMAVVTLTNAMAALEAEEKEEIEKILDELSAYVGEYKAELMGNMSALFELDFLFAKGKLSIFYHGVEPQLNQEGIVNIQKARHPLLDPKVVVPVDIYLGEEFDTLVITGPNTGGKTVSLKTLGLLSLMGASGLHITAGEHSQLAVFSNIFADIGDEQSIEQSLSTFSSHLVNLVSILNRLDDKSLVLADELGAGTDPAEGAALAIAILDFIRSYGAKAVATTHYSELKLYALSTERVENASCEFNIKTLSPTYRLLIGVPGKSNAFAISKRLGLSDTILDHATSLLHADNVQMEDVLARLERNRQRTEKERKQAETINRDAHSLRAELIKERETLDRQRAKIIEEARAEALRILESAKEESQRTLKELRSIRDNAALKEALQQAEQAKAALRDKQALLSEKNHKQKRTSKPPKNLKVGDVVRIISLDQEATVLELPDGAGNVQLQAGIMKIKAKLSDLIYEHGAEKKNKQTSHVSRSHSGSTNMKTELDLRGQTLDEALLEVDRFIDRALLANLQTVTVIHGKGTGVLRKGISEYLKKHPMVTSYRAGQLGEGDTGVTVVSLK